jgi:hypothetical protein
LLEVLPLDEEEIPIHGENGNPPMFDFFGLGKHAPGPFLYLEENDGNHIQDQVGWNHWDNAAGPDGALVAILNQVQDGFLPDLNLEINDEVVVEDHAEFFMLDLNVLAQEDVMLINDHGGNPEHNVPEGPISLEMHSYQQSANDTREEIEQAQSK